MVKSTQSENILYASENVWFLANKDDFQQNEKHCSYYGVHIAASMEIHMLPSGGT